MSRIRVVLIDLDMTLVDTARQCYEVIARLKNLRNVTFEEFMSLYYDSGGIRSGLFKILGDDALSYEFWNRCWSRYIEEGNYGVVLPGALEALRRIGEMGKAIIIATGREVRSVEMLGELRAYGFMDMVDGVVALGDLGPGHRKDDLLKMVVNVYGRGRPEGMVYVTDHPRDVEICRVLGMRTIGVLNSWIRAIKADKVIEGLAKLPMAIRELEEG